MSGSKATAKKTLGVIFVFGALLSMAKLNYSVNQIIPVSEENTSFVIKKGESFNSVIGRLSDEYGTTDVFWTKLVYRFRGIPIVQAGRYNIYPETPIYRLVDRFSNGDIQKFRFTVIEGSTAKRAKSKLQDIIQQNNLNFDLPNEVNRILSQEAAILPDTYFFSDAEDLVRVLQTSENFLDEFINELWQKKPQSNPLKTPLEAMVLASIIEREAVLASEKSTIASVFLFRLVKGMRLQADPTSSYGFYKDYGPKIGRKVLDDKNEFNTYQIEGLPPSPISYPSKASIEAAIMSIPGEYLYFVAKGDGSHVFSKNYEDHNKAVKKYIYSK